MKTCKQQKEAKMLDKILKRLDRIEALVKNLTSEKRAGRIFLPLLKHPNF